MGWFGRKEHDEEQLSAYIDGELSAREAEIVERHLSTCDACAGLLEELRSTRTLLSQLPAQAPRRSFVLGAEHARAPVRGAASRPRPGFALIPAAALSVFVALLFVDLSGTTNTSSDESANALTAASRQVDDGSAGAGSADAPNAATGSEGASTFQSEAMMEEAGQEPPQAPETARDSIAAAGAAEAEGPATLRSGGPEGSPGEADTAINAGDQPPAEDPAPQPLEFDAPEPEAGDGISTLRVLQVVAGAAFLASGFYVFVWPRVSRGGS